MPDTQARKGWMSLLARAPAALLAERLAAFGDAPAHVWLRPPEIGSVMLRGRAGATGAPFNLGEMTVTRCALRLESGEVGHAVVQGRDCLKAERAALVDALMQTERADALRAAVLAPLAHALEAQSAARAANAAATKVAFLTLARGDM